MYVVTLPARGGAGSSGVIFSLPARGAPLDPPTKMVFVADDGPDSTPVHLQHGLEPSAIIDVQGIGRRPGGWQWYLVNPGALIADG